MTTPPLTGNPIQSAQELTDHWSALLDPPVFGSRALWLTWLADDGQPLRVVIPVDDLPRFPHTGLLFGLLGVHDAIADEHLDGGGHLAMALCRPGPPAVTEDDDEWVDAFHEVLDDRLDGNWSLHLAADGSVQPLVDLPE